RRWRSDYSPTMYSNPSLRVTLFGAAKPGSRPHHWQSIFMPGTVSAGRGAGEPVPCAKAFMSSMYRPLQSFAGGRLPPELTAPVRRSGDFTHSVPPWNGSVEG